MPASRFHVSSIPTLLLFKDGESVQRLVGVQSKQVLAAELDALVA